MSEETKTTTENTNKKPSQAWEKTKEAGELIVRVAVRMTTIVGCGILALIITDKLGLIKK